MVTGVADGHDVSGDPERVLDSRLNLDRVKN